jgi:hypothetical protein
LVALGVLVACFGSWRSVCRVFMLAWLSPWRWHSVVCSACFLTTTSCENCPAARPWRQQQPSAGG